MVFIVQRSWKHRLSNVQPLVISFRSHAAAIYVYFCAINCFENSSSSPVSDIPSSFHPAPGIPSSTPGIPFVSSGRPLIATDFSVNAAGLPLHNNSGSADAWLTTTVELLHVMEPVFGRRLFQRDHASNPDSWIINIVEHAIYYLPYTSHGSPGISVGPQEAWRKALQDTNRLCELFRLNTTTRM